MISFIRSLLQFLFKDKETVQEPIEEISQILAKCGHMTPLKGWISAFGETTDLVINPPKNKEKPEHCINCIQDMTIVCGKCGKAIFISEPIHEFRPRKPDEFGILEHSFVSNHNPLIIVGCGRTTCVDTGLDYSGVWWPPGRINYYKLVDGHRKLSDT